MTLTKPGCDTSVTDNDCQLEAAQDVIRQSVYYNKTLIYGAFGALGWDEQVLVFEGVPKVRYYSYSSNFID